MTEREAALEAELEAARIEVKLLKGKVDAPVRMVLGQKSENLDPNQLMLQGTASKKDDAPAPDDDSESGAIKPQRKRRH